MVSQLRAQRIADRISQELSEILLYDIADPRLSGVYISGVRVDRELAFADIYVSALEGSQRADEVLEGFKHAQGYLRRELAQRIELRTFPRLRFEWDATFEQADRVDRLIASIQAEREALQEDQPDESEEAD